MKYLIRLLVVLTFIPRVILATVAFIIIFYVDILAIPVYYIMTGRFYWEDYSPLHVAVFAWLVGNEWEWRNK